MTSISGGKIVVPKTLLGDGAHSPKSKDANFNNNLN